jgi:mannose-6-phosphate isomerase-like protein (cupin superfamily)
MPAIERTPTGYMFGDALVKAIFNIEEVMKTGLHEYPDNPEYADYFLTADDWRLRVKICRVTYAPNNPNPWHLHFHSHSDTAHFIMTGDGDALMEKDTWAPVQAGDLIYAKPGQVHGIRVTRPDQEVWYVSVVGPGPVTIGDLSGRIIDVVENGPPAGRTH